jgi:hypothetical protein
VRPFFFYAGQPEDQELLGEPGHVTWIEKPLPRRCWSEPASKSLVDQRHTGMQPPSLNSRRDQPFA